MRSTPTPSSSTARTMRSTSTRVLPLPAPACRLEAAQLADREHVERGLHAAVLLPACHRVALASALVVGDERVAVPRVDAVYLAAHPHPVTELDRGQLALRHAELELELPRL